MGSLRGLRAAVALSNCPQKACPWWPRLATAILGQHRRGTARPPPFLPWAPPPATAAVGAVAPVPLTCVPPAASPARRASPSLSPPPSLRPGPAGHPARPPAPSPLDAKPPPPPPLPAIAIRARRVATAANPPHEPCMFHVRLHVIPQPPHRGDQQHPLPNQLSLSHPLRPSNRSLNFPMPHPATGTRTAP